MGKHEKEKIQETETKHGGQDEESFESVKGSPESTPAITNKVNEDTSTTPKGGSRIEIIKEKTEEVDEWEYHWMLFSKNGKMIATNPLPFSRLNDLKTAIKSVKENIINADIIRKY